ESFRCLWDFGPRLLLSCQSIPFHIVYELPKLRWLGWEFGWSFLIHERKATVQVSISNLLRTDNMSLDTPIFAVKKAFKIPKLEGHILQLLKIFIPKFHKFLAFLKGCDSGFNN